MRRAQKCKKDSQVISLFTLSGSGHTKAAHKYVCELTPGIDFINNLQAAVIRPNFPVLNFYSINILMFTSYLKYAQLFLLTALHWALENSA